MELLNKLISALKHCANEQKPVDAQEAIKIMQELSGMALNIEQLKESKAAETISSLRKHECPTIAAEAKKLRLKWVEEHRTLTKKEEKSEPSKRKIIVSDDEDKNNNKRLKTNDNDTQRSSSREKKPVTFYKDEIQSIEESKPRKSSGGSGNGKVEVYTDIKQAIPTKNAKGELVFPDYPHFRPNLTPKEVLQKGSFGGTYFRPIYSRVTQQHYSDVWKELPADWLSGLNIPTQVSSAQYRTSINRYKETCGGDLDMWESSGWITHIDPYGWFQWYCRFYQGRRSSDDERQISRGMGVMGPKGRWRSSLVNKCLAAGRPQDVVDKQHISPKIRQLLQHWGYQLTVDDLIAAAKAKK